MKRASGFLLAAVLGCDRKETPPAPAPSAEAAPVVATVSAVPSASAAPSSSVEKPVLATEGCGAARPDIPIRSVKSIGHTSIVFKIEFDSNQKVVWKPSSKRGKERWRGEIAAAKLGDALGISSVVPACYRTYTVAQLSPHLPKGGLDEVIAGEDGTIRGAVISWVEGLSFLAADKEPLKSEAKTWLQTPAPVPFEKMVLASELSNLVVFDAISGNWDRYSGANIGLDGTQRHLLFVDNDAAFMEGAPPKNLAENDARVAATQRFSRSFVKRLRTVDVTKAFGTLPDGSPLLNEGMQKTIAERLAKITKVLDAKLAAAKSEADVLYFP